MRKRKKLSRECFQYGLTRKEIFIGMAQGTIYLAVTSILFFDSLISMIFMLPYLHLHLKEKAKRKREKNYEMTSVQFKDGMLSISASLSAGYAVENAFREAAGELENLYGSEAVMVKEFKGIVRKIDLNENVEDALEVMAEKLELEEAVYFAEVFRFAKRSGGNLMEIIGKTARNIGDKIAVKEDIAVLISGKKMEQKIMNLMPYGIIAYLRIGAYEFISPIYGGLMGRVMMTVCLAGYLTAKKLSEKITEISV